MENIAGKKEFAEIERRLEALAREQVGVDGKFVKTFGFPEG